MNIFNKKIKNATEDYINEKDIPAVINSIILGINIDGILKNIIDENMLSTIQKIDKILNQSTALINKLMLEDGHYQDKIIMCLRFFIRKLNHNQEDIDIVNYFANVIYKFFVLDKYCYYKKNWYKCNKNGIWEYIGLFNCYFDLITVAVAKENRAKRKYIESNPKLKASEINEIRKEQKRNLRIVTNTKYSILREVEHLATINELYDGLIIDKYKIIFPDCLFNLKSGETEPILPSMHIANSLLIPYNGEYSISKFDNLLNTVCTITDKDNNKKIDKDTKIYLSSILGYALTPRNTWKECYIFQGGSNTGKSTIAQLISNAFATRYKKPLVGQVAVDIIENTVTNNVDSERRIVKLDGKTLVFTSEPNRQLNLNEAFIKLITGEIKVSGRFLYQESREISLVSTLCIITNHLPTIKDIDDSIWNRIKIVPFNNVLPVDPDYIDKYTEADYRGIIRYLLAYASKSYEYKPQTSERVDIATKSYRQDENIYSEALERIFEATKNNKECTTPKAAYAAYCSLSRMGMAPEIKNQRNFNDIVKQSYRLDNITIVTTIDDKRLRIIPGLKLTSEFQRYDTIQFNDYR